MMFFLNLQKYSNLRFLDQTHIFLRPCCTNLQLKYKTMATKNTNIHLTHKILDKKTDRNDRFFHAYFIINSFLVCLNSPTLIW